MDVETSLEWVRDSRGVHRLARPRGGWPGEYSWLRLLHLATVLWLGNTVHMRQRYGSGAWIEPVGTGFGRVYNVGSGRTVISFASAHDALRGAMCEFGADPWTAQVA